METYLWVQLNLCQREWRKKKQNRKINFHLINSDELNYIHTKNGEIFFNIFFYNFNAQFL